MRRAGLISVVAFGTLAAPAQADVQVSVGNNAFSPAAVTVTEGEIVTWRWNAADKNHSVTSEAMNDQRGSFDSHPNNPFPTSGPPDDQFSKEFEFAGEYRYFCKTHTYMTGRVVVRDRTNNPNPPPVDTVAPRFGTTRVSLRKRRVTFRLNEPASVVARLRGRMRRTYRVDGVAGTNRIRLPRRMRPGRYSLALQATDEAGNVSTRVVRRFRVKRRR